MPDVTEQVEVVETPVQSEVVDASEANVQPESTDSFVSEDVTNTDETDSTGKGGDLRVALQQERQQRQAIEEQQKRLLQALEDPNFIYEQARRHGLTDAEAQEVAEQAQNSQVPQYRPQDIVSAAVAQAEARAEAKADYKEAIELVPELATDPDLKAWAGSLVNQGKSHVEAAKIVQRKLGLVKQTAKAEGVTQATTEVTAKEQAQTAPVAVAGDSEAAYMEDLKKRMKSYDRKTNEEAHVEYNLWKMKNRK